MAIVNLYDREEFPFQMKYCNGQRGVVTGFIRIEESDLENQILKLEELLSNWSQKKDASREERERMGLLQTQIKALKKFSKQNSHLPVVK